jgi:hypothetical protein
MSDGYQERDAANYALARAGYKGAYNNGRPFADGTGVDLVREMAREASRGRALAAPIVNTKVDVSVTLDGRAIAAAVSSKITTDNRTVNSSSGFDGRASWARPDVP